MPFIPLYDENRIRFIPFQIVTVVMIVACVIVFFWQQASGGSRYEDASLLIGFGFIPAAFTGLITVPDAITHLPSWATLITYAFLHIDFWHLAGNMLFLWVFGDNVEDELGHGRYALFYVLCAIASAFGHLAAGSASQVPLVGASGAVSGVLAAYLVLHPSAKVWCLLFWRIPLRAPAWAALGAWFVFQVVMAMAAGPDADTAWLGHVAGFLAGIPLVYLLRRRNDLDAQAEIA